MKTDKLVLVKALNWVNLHLKEHPEAEKVKAVEAAAVKFGLSPIDEDWLFNQLSQGTSSAATDGTTSSR